MFPRQISGWVVLAGALLIPGHVTAATIVVPTDQPTIADAVGVTASGDTVLILPGTYVEHRIRIEHSLHLAGDGAGVVVDGSMLEIPPPDTTSIFIANAPLTTFDNLHLVQGQDAGQHGQGGAIRGLAGDIRITGCTFAENMVSEGGGAVYGGPGTSVLVTDCFFEGNVSDGLPGGAIMVVEGALRCTGTTFAAGYGGDGGAIGGEDSQVEVEDCMFRDNRVGAEFSAGFAGGAIHLLRCEFEIMDCTFIGNVANDPWMRVGSGGAIYVYAGGGGISHCVFFDNRAATRGGALALSMSGAGTVVDHCTFVANRDADGPISVLLGAHVNVYDGAPQFHHNIFADAADAAGFICEQNAAPALSCNNLWNSPGEDLEGCLPTSLESNFSADPLFCDDSTGDFHLRADSPCAPENAPPGCGLVGALGVACEPHAVDGATWGGIKARYR